MGWLGRAQTHKKLVVGGESVVKELDNDTCSVRLLACEAVGGATGVLVRLGQADPDL